jgi:predicted SAM-dependent methyltransferase
MPSKLRKRLYSLSGPVLKPVSKLAWFFYVRMSKKIRVIIGSGDTLYWGWFPTDIKTLDITNEKDLKFYFAKRKMDFILAEHVLEHLETADLELMALNIKKYSNKGVNFRVAVPDGYHY